MQRLLDRAIAEAIWEFQGHSRNAEPDLACDRPYQDKSRTAGAMPKPRSADSRVHF